MIQLIIDAFYYCCFNRPGKNNTPFEVILKNIDDLAHHEIEFIENQITKKNKFKMLLA